MKNNSVFFQHGDTNDYIFKYGQIFFILTHSHLPGLKSDRKIFMILTKKIYIKVLLS